MMEILLSRKIRRVCLAVVAILLAAGLIIWLYRDSPSLPPTSGIAPSDAHEEQPSLFDAESGSEQSQGTPRLPVDGVSGLAIPDGDGARDFGGIVIDRDVPLRRGTLTAWADKGRGRVALALGEDGTFKGALPTSGFPYNYAQVTISDGQANAFSGLVRVGTDLRILVESSWRTAKQGHIFLPDNKRMDDWFVTVTSRDESKNDLIGTGDFCRGTSGTFSWILFDPRAAQVTGPVDLVVSPSQPHVSYFGHKRFGSLVAFQMALGEGIHIPCPEHSVDAGHVSGTLFKSLVLRSRENWKAVYFCDKNAEGTFVVSAPDGDYAVAGTSAVGQQAIGTVVLRTGGAASVEWLGQLPGDRVVRTRIRNSAGLPVEGLRLHYATFGSAAGLHGGRTAQRSNSEGELAIDGLLPLKYEVQTEVEGVRGGAVLGRIDATIAAHQDLVYDGAFSVGLQVVGAEAFGIDSIGYHTCRVWLRPSGGQWRRVATTNAQVRGIGLGALSEGIYDIAVQGSSWGGECTREIAASGTVQVPVDLLETLKGRLVSSRGTDLSGLMVRLRFQVEGGDVERPWAICEVGPDGAFELGVWSRDGSVEHFDVLRNREVVISCPLRVLQGGGATIDIDGGR